MTAAPYTDLPVWRSILWSTVNTSGDSPRPMLSRMHVQLYGGYTALAGLQAMLLKAQWIGKEELTAFLWPGWAPCLFTKQPSYPPTECGFVVGLAWPHASRLAAGELAEAYATPNTFFWEWGLMEGLPTRNQYT